MLKQDERDKSDSCWNKGGDEERMFILLARDPVAPSTIRFWVDERVSHGLNAYDDPKIREALECADLMERGIHQSGPCRPLNHGQD